ncbi:endonuclease domain-containing 1 protein-like isoform X3 [Siniperca chuatsi]|uniref:endonuclease domain-containing 1 protein-like isoform X3 n=1 Tax=Siniperca chuatsi TaxID=119488 RepID=UPI001CE21513|nr:endonuclease domain-containing 1 protein-like isoform X3 [Siniperca chuatsi]
MSNTKMLMSGKPVHEVSQCLTMTSMKTWYLLFLAGFLPIVPTAAEVVGSMSKCTEFLLDGTPPQVPGILEGGNILNQNRYKPICQTFDNKRRFVTLYDIKNKIPVFSAYKYRGYGGGRRPPNNWKIEPQLEKEDDKNMWYGDKYNTYNNQAGNTDYRNNEEFDRGHLFPSSYAFTKTDKISTFTLTNIVPQAKTSNQGSWNRMEKCIKCVMDKYCINNNNVTEGFVVTGAQPSTNNILKNRINIPSMLWSAFCCYSSEKKMWIASAHWGDNVPDDPKNKYLQTKSLAELHEVLKTADSEFNVFPETKCPLHTTVTEFYPDNKNCDCPPSISTTSAPPTSTSAPPTSTSGPPTSTSGPPPPHLALPPPHLALHRLHLALHRLHLALTLPHLDMPHLHLSP